MSYVDGRRVRDQTADIKTIILIYITIILVFKEELITKLKSTLLTKRVSDIRLTIGLSVSISWL